MTQPKALSPYKITMSAQQRYRTLVQHICRIYSANDGGMTALTAGLNDILERINPSESSDWKKVQADSKRLLRIWHSRADDDDSAADEVVDQITESLKEFTVIDVLVDKPILVVSEVTHVPVFNAVTLSANPDVVEEEVEEEVEEVEEEVEVEIEVEEDEAEEEEAEESTVVVIVKKEAVEDDSESVIEPSDEKDDMPINNGSSRMDLDDEDEEPVKSNGIIPAASEAEAEEEAEEEEEEGMEVEKRIIRGRPYWIDINTNKLYTIIGDDDVGDEVGAIFNGKPVFKHV